MNNRELILSSVKMIEDNLRSNITVLDISKELGFSFYYYSRLFKAITGHSPKSYMLARKITESVTALIETNIRIIDLAFEFGFGSPEAYTRVFYKIVNKNPSDIRKKGAINKQLLLQPLTNQTLKKYEHALDKEPEMVSLGEIKLVGIPFFYDLSMKNDLTDPWSMLTRNIGFIPNIQKPEKFYQLQFWFSDQESDNIYFFVAAAVDRIKSIPIQLTAKIIPAQTYFKFRHKGLANQVGYTYQYIYENWLPKTNYKLPGYFNFEYYGDAYLGPYNQNSISEVYIPIENK